MKISIVHPSRQRPEIAEQVIKEWIGKAKNPENIQYILSIDKDDSCLDKYRDICKKNQVDIIESINRSAIDAINRGAENSIGDLLIVVSDDFSCPDGWDDFLLKELDGKEDFLVKTQDGIQKYIVTMPIMDRKFYERFGYVYMPYYKHLWCDSELFCVGWIMDKIIFSDLLFSHNHYSIGKSQKDSINVRNDKTWGQGKRLFYNRKDSWFDIPKELRIKEFPYFAGYKKKI